MKPFQTRKDSILKSDSFLEELHVFKNFPVFIGATIDPPETDIFCDMAWDICKQTGIIQLRNLLPPSLIYSGYHSEAVGKVWENHHIEFSKFVTKFSKKKILEIGGSNGKLASLLCDFNQDYDITIVEPNPPCTMDKRLRVIKCFFDNQFINSNNQKYSSVVHSHTFEHVYDPLVFIQYISDLLNNGDTHIFSIPNLYKYLVNNFTNTLNFEHSYFLTEYFCDYLLAKNKFRIVEKYYFNEHSIFYATVKDDSIKEPTLSNKYNEYKLLFLNFIDHYYSEINRINLILKDVDSNSNLYVFGAHIFTQFLVSIGLNLDKIISVLDNSSDKKNKRLYGTNLKINSPAIIESDNFPVVILKAGQYQDEIKKQLLSLNSNVRIIN